MYQWLIGRLPAPLVNVLYAGWYAALIILVYYFMDRDMVGFYYLHR